MSQSRGLRSSLVGSGLLLALVGAAAADPAPHPVTVFLERGGRLVDHDGDEVAIPKFGGGDRVWSSVVTCVQQQFSPFAMDIVDTEPTGDHIVAVIGGRASLVGLDDRSTNGVGPYIPGRVQRNATVHIFSQVGTGERDIQNLCAVTVHEVSHALGLDHTFKCGDVMSYFLDRCGARKFLDVDAPCGETSARLCGDGSRSQNSYRAVAAAVGLRNPDPKQPMPKPAPDVDDTDDRGNDDADGGTDDSGDTTDSNCDDTTTANEDPWAGARDTTQRSSRRDGGGRYTVEHVRGRDGRHWVIIREMR